MKRQHSWWLIFYYNTKEWKRGRGKYKRPTEKTDYVYALPRLMPNPRPRVLPASIFQATDSVLFGHTKPLSEIFLHEGKAIPQLDFWLPSQQFFGLCDVRFPLSWIIRSVLHLLYLHLRINELQSKQVKHW